MTSYFEIDGEIISCDEVTDPYAQLPSSALEESYRLHLREQISEELTGDPNALQFSEETKKPGLVEHYLRSLWYAGTEPTRRVFESPELMIPAIKSPRSLLGLAVDITVEGLENQYVYFIKDENPWD